MKVTLDVDCTPQEARTFLGLPDLAPLHAAYVEKMGAVLGERPAPEMFAEMVKTWAPMSEAGMGVWRQMLDQMGRKTSD